MTLGQWLYVTKWAWLRSPLAATIGKPAHLRSYLRDRYAGIRYATPYWATPRWRRWLRDYGSPRLKRIRTKLSHLTAG